jgi:uroporphyrinogen decarboxylase
MYMSSKARVHAALGREPVDRVPIWMWYHPTTTVRLAVLLEIPISDVAAAMGDDIRQTWVGGNHAMEGIVHDEEGQGHTDFWGIEWVKIGHFNQIRHSPLRGADEKTIRAYRYPDEHADALLSNMDRVVADSESHGEERFVGCDISPCLFEMVYRIRGMDDALLDVLANPELSQFMIGQAARFSLKLAELACDRYDLDWLWSGDDVAGQTNMMMSPSTWRETVKPHLARIFAVARKHDVWMAHHCCGAMRSIIPDLIEIGLDVLNPIQCNSPGMEPLGLKADFGSEIAFMGGVDTQDLLPNGTADEVFRATRRLVDGMTTGGGGYILAASHAVPPETPLDNVFAMYEAAGVSRSEIFDRAAAIRNATAIAGR